MRSPGGSAGEWRRSSRAGEGTSRSEDPAKNGRTEKILFFSEKRLTSAPQGANLLWILSGEQFSLYEKGKKDKKPPLQRFANFSETLAPAYLSRYAERRGGKCRLRSASYSVAASHVHGLFYPFPAASTQLPERFARAFLLAES